MSDPRSATLLRREVADLLGVSIGRVSQLVKAGNLRLAPDGRITPEEVQRCRREEAINWAHPQAKGGRPSRAEIAKREEITRWLKVRYAMEHEGWGDLHAEQWRRLFQSLIAAVKHYNPQALLEVNNDG
jgi:transposase